MSEEQLDQALNAMRDEPLPARDTQAARDRVWRKISAASPCVQFRADMNEYRAGGLPLIERLAAESPTPPPSTM